MEISRQDLYERVWKTPLRKLATEFGISDVGLAKACRRHAIPTPPMGHWTRIEHGKSSERPPLPAAPHGDTVSLSQEQSRAQRLPTGAPVLKEVKVPVASDTASLTPFAKATFATLSKTKPDRAGLVSCGGGAHFQATVSPALAERACRILDAIERKLPELGGQVTKGADNKPLYLDMGGQPVTFTLTERYTRTEIIPESERKSPYPRKEYAYHLTGELKFAIEGYFEGRKTWSDGTRAKLEDKLPEVLAGLAAAAAAMKQLAEERAEQHRRWEEEARIRQEREEKARRRAAFREAFATEAAGWQRHQAAAEYLAHLRKSLEGDPQLPELSTEWLAHAEQAVADLDPTGRRLRLLHEGVKPDWYGPFGAKLVEDKRPPGI
ncbi:hypothetical protein GCM10028796_41530 [Ramlibacter monticola]|uniref:Uncharacterized protein n=1 Tax=Ramlibacter monticola TaxID=1926872 RepID=A0A936Z393_9BURK|nr:hypothetical protein [Ramlibacter monticola]MBL0393567.1 hypothetical protein [Ramlibacter monticola]